MNHITKLIILLITTMAVSTMFAAKGYTYKLWPEGAPNTNGNATDTAQVTIYLPDAKKSTGRAIVVCPGGGYAHLAMEHEGHDWATFFNQQGIALVVLKYRMPRGNYEIPISDAEKAIRMVRQHSKEWKIDKDKVGIMGFSAGGHLASTVATHSKGDAKPNFQILFYPVITMDRSYTHYGSHDNFLGKNRSKKQLRKLEREYSNELQVTRATPPAFIALSDDDTVVLPSNSANYYLECMRHDVAASMHIYPTGGHGWGYKNSFAFHAEMILELRAWLQNL